MSELMDADRLRVTLEHLSWAAEYYVNELASEALERLLAHIAALGEKYAAAVALAEAAERYYGAAFWTVGADLEDEPRRAAFRDMDELCVAFKAAQGAYREASR